ncbi:endonuclease/exonuclease/phosphatase family protein [Thaumasiovibrio subtropicus]|uniref:endonuclease/exonuclease/phosphatase family protein n=1 Tax=Thaumasiovibrio subtropicus TaxID=1891207 RepID=UPI00131ABF76|nr:endonuclease/exonuclease/phosphatase family protein [Thaumasiovibrio subtropicus]
MRFALLWILFCSLVASSHSTTLTIVSWNIEWLSTKSDKVTRTQQDFAKLANTLAALQPDVLAFQEVDSAYALEKVLPPDTYAIYLSHRRPSNPKQSQQYTGFAVRHGVNVRRQPDLSALSSSSGLRNGTYLIIDGIKPLHVLNVHLKSGCFSDIDRAKKSCRTLKRQFGVLSEWINERVTKGEDYLILGDFNHRLAISNWLKTWQDSITKAEMSLITEGLDASCYARRRNGGYVRYDALIDHAVSNRTLAETILQHGSVSQFQIALQDIKQYRLSDHCPIALRLPFDN